MAESFDISKFAQEAGINVGTEPGLELGVTARNIIPSLKKNMGDIIQAVTNPRETVTGLLRVGGGYASKAGIPGLSEFAPYADAMNQMILDRYGGVENAMNTIETDPVGFLMDFSGVMGAGGKLAKMSGFDNAGDLITAAANAVDPVNQGVNLMGATAGIGIPRAAPESLYGGGAKPGTTMSPQQRRQFNRTAVEQGIMPNDAGLARFGAQMADLRTQIDGLIDQATEKGGTVDASVLFDSLDEMRAAVESGGSVDKVGDLAQIEKVEKKLAQSIYGKKAADGGVTLPKPLTARQLQNIKIDAYDRGYRASRRDKPPLREQAYQAIGRAARENIENLAGPRVAPLNRQLGNLLEMRTPLERAANRIDQRYLFSLPQAIGASPGLAVGDPVSALLGTAFGGLISPEMQARMGIGLEALRTMPRSTSTPFRRVPYAPSLLSTGAYSGRARQGLLDRGLPLN